MLRLEGAKRSKNCIAATFLNPYIYLKHANTVFKAEEKMQTQLFSGLTPHMTPLKRETVRL